MDEAVVCLTSDDFAVAFNFLLGILCLCLWLDFYCNHAEGNRESGDREKKNCLQREATAVADESECRAGNSRPLQEMLLIYWHLIQDPRNDYSTPFPLICSIQLSIR